VTLQWLDRPEVRAVRLFGSLARGDQQEASDADVLILLKGNPPFDHLEQTRRFLAFFDLPIGVDILVYSEGQAAARLQEDGPFLVSAWQDQIEL
jgi:predicted nucleotidyltransferase